MIFFSDKINLSDIDELIVTLPRYNNVPVYVYLVYLDGQKVTERYSYDLDDTNKFSYYFPIKEKYAYLVGETEEGYGDYLEGKLKYETKKHKVEILCNPKDHIEEYFRFIYSIMVDLPELNYGTYKSKKGNYVIKIQDYLYRGGMPLNANAGVNIKTGLMKISKLNMLKKFTIYERIAVMCHEYGHYIGNTKYGISKRNEIGADLIGMKMFIEYGFHPFDYLNAFLKVFSYANHQINKKRWEFMLKFAKKHYKFRDKRRLLMDKYCIFENNKKMLK